MPNKLLIFSYDFPPSNGGIARLCQEIASGMVANFEEVIILTRKVNAVRNTYNKDVFTLIELPSQRIKCEWKAFNYLKNIKNKENVTVLCGLWHPEAALALLAGIKNVYILGHGTEFLAGSSNFRRFFWLPIYAKLILGKVKLNLANSKYTNGLIHKINPKATSVVLPLGVNAAFFRPIENISVNPKKFKIATLSRIEQFKGYDFIAKTIAALPENEKKNIQWNIGGTGPYLESFKKLVLQLAIQEQVCFHGFIPDEKLPDFYNANDIFVLCTREEKNTTAVEGFGLVFLEAQSCGIPVVATNSGGISDAVVNENGGWLIAQDNEEELSAILLKCKNNPEILKTQSLKARTRVLENCTWKIYNSNLKQLLLS